ncbi:MAG: hypothetical protein JOZ67_02005, partial [Gammaproteobacteria bacterium]|nr:hypothetical protein [Gammaproteobacteria bacterium]
MHRLFRELCAVRSRIAVALLLGGATLAGAQDAPQLLDARVVLQQIGRERPTAPRESEGTKLAAAIYRFRASGATAGPEQAAAEWFSLLDKVTVDGAAARFDFTAYDKDLHSKLGVGSVIAALPPPPAWPALQREAARRGAHAPGDYHAPSVALLAAVLRGDRAATSAALKQIDTAIANLPPAERVVPQVQLRVLRSYLIKLYGTPSEVADAFLDETTNLARAGASFRSVEVPDLVTLVGEPRARQILSKALLQPVTLHVEAGDATRSLARQIALANIDALREPQWALVDSLEAAPLYEALVRRFRAAEQTPAAEESPSDARRSADIYYLLFLIANDRQDEARKLLETLSAGQTVTVPKPAVDALQRAHRNEALYAFLDSVLTAHPEVRAWEVYLEQAAYTGHGREALATLDGVLRRKDLAVYLRNDLQARRIDALLALGDTAHAIPLLIAQLRTPLNAEDPALQQRASAAIRAAGLGRVLHRSELELLGLRFAEHALALPSRDGADSMPSFDRATLLREVLAEARKQHKDAEAQQVALAELTRHDAGAEAMARQRDMVGMPGQWATRDIALVELVSLYSAAQRPKDARAILDEAEDWDGRDLQDFIDQKDSQDVPLLVLAGRVLEASGERASAVTLAKAAIQQFPGFDGAYELESRIDPQAAQVFDDQFRKDQFEERPLIWRGVLLESAGHHAEAEKELRAAIAIDPSDGDEGKNDRMRAYAVLADALAAQGEAKSAAEYREVVAAIRISEQSDELHALGLYQQA